MPEAAARPKPVLLLILDGWGHRDEPADNAVAQAELPNWRRLWSDAPHTLIATSGQAVGLPDGQMGNSEVGHMNLGGGRVVYQDLTRIDRAIDDGSFFDDAELLAACAAVDVDHTLHVMGLLSEGGVHSHQTQIFAMLELARRAGVQRVAVHAFLDGRDTPPRSALASLQALQARCDALGNARIASVSGRYYAMDRDRRWDRLRLAWDAIVEATSLHSAPDAVAALEAAYARGENDEFVLPTVIDSARPSADGALRQAQDERRIADGVLRHAQDERRIADGVLRHAQDERRIADGVLRHAQDERRIADGDAVVFMNFRADRARQLTAAFVSPTFEGFDVRRPKLARFVCLTQYDATLPAPAAFAPDDLRRTLGEIVAQAGLTQLRIAETEKYAHVTFFFNGGREEPFAGESRIVVPSPMVATYDLQPEMSCPELTAKLIEAIGSGTFDVIVCNIANPDMVGHSGDLGAAIKAAEAVDVALGAIDAAVRAAHGAWLITADHGNLEMMRDPDTGQPHTAHTTGPVPLVYVGDRAGVTLRDGGALRDVAPTLLDLLSLAQPAQMTGRSLFA